MKIARKIRFLTMGLLISILAIGGGVAVVASEEEAKGANSDVMIYLDHPILTSGGTVMVLPTEVEKEVWVQQQGLENPAEGDRLLDNIRPIQSADRRLGVIVSATVSVVRFHFPRGGNYKFAFAPLDRSKASDLEGRTKLLRHGEGTDVDPTTGKDVHQPRIITVHVMGSDANEDKSLDADTRTKFVALEHYYTCRKFEQAVACDVASERAP
ncbi:hypothetical protein E2F50_20165 [Rhizobium deserti]|uniref:Uncharacterized protein n=1 Tax=Rhizobium deserti TaxID=2547961 RepID=A0A4R5U9I8_9HYPH|nr:hypothetical protein [Rhizobium deserti]TDK31261.1 hypothetical protein E2F50_20165 [Rhizobium deserti]